MTDRDHRPRTTYAAAARLCEHAEALNGDGVPSFHAALSLLLDYLALLDGDAECPACGTDLQPFRAGGREVAGKFQCPDCHGRDEWYDAFDVLDVDDREQARVPGLRQAASARFAAVGDSDARDAGRRLSDAGAPRR